MSAEPGEAITMTEVVRPLAAGSAARPLLVQLSQHLPSQFSGCQWTVPLGTPSWVPLLPSLPSLSLFLSLLVSVLLPRLPSHTRKAPVWLRNCCCTRHKRSRQFPRRVLRSPGFCGPGPCPSCSVLSLPGPPHIASHLPRPRRNAWAQMALSEMR